MSGKGRKVKTKDLTKPSGPGSGRRTLRYHIHPAIKGKRKGGDA